MPANTSFPVTVGRRPLCSVVIGEPAASDDLYAAQHLVAEVERISGVRLEVLTTTGDLPKGNSIILGSLDSNPVTNRILRAERVLVTPEELAAEVANAQWMQPAELGPGGFVIYPTQADGHDLLFASGGMAQGTAHAAATLADHLLMDDDKLVVDGLQTCLLPRFHRSPFERRGINTNIGGPDWLGPGQWAKEWGVGDGYDHRGYVDWMVEHKLNHMIVYSFCLNWGIAYPSERFPELVNPFHPNVTHEFMGDLIEYAHQRHIEVFWFFEVPDNWTSVIRAYPELAGKNVDVSRLSDDATWAHYQKTGEEWADMRYGGSWVCTSEERTLAFWREYLDELMSQYPAVDGMGIQFCEVPTTRCDCSGCKDRFFEHQTDYLLAMKEVIKQYNPDARAWILRTWGAKDMLRQIDRFSDLIVIDWFGVYPQFATWRFLPRSDWYMYHFWNDEWPEFGLREAMLAFSQQGVRTVHLRAPKYKENDRINTAFTVYTWQPTLPLADFANFYVGRHLRRRDLDLSEAYRRWLEVVGYAEMLTVPDVPPAWAKRESYRDRLRVALDGLSDRVAELGVPDEYLAAARKVAEAESPTVDDLAWSANWQARKDYY